MQVNIFISEVDGNMGGSPKMLILPVAPDAAIPAEFRSEEWTYFTTTTTEDKLLGAKAAAIEVALASKGYAVVEPSG